MEHYRYSARIAATGEIYECNCFKTLYKAVLLATKNCYRSSGLITIARFTRNGEPFGQLGVAKNAVVMTFDNTRCIYERSVNA